MSSYLEGMQIGRGLAKDGFDAYDLARQWSHRLTAEKEAKKVAIDKSEEDKIEKARHEQHLNDTYELERRKQDWAENPNNPLAIRADKAPAGGAKNATGGKSLELTDYQRESLLQKASANFLKASTDNDAAGVDLYGGLIQQYGGEVPEYEDKSHWWQKKTPKFGENKESAPKPWKSYLPAKK